MSHTMAARLALFESVAGGLRSPLPNPTRSLLVVLDAWADEQLSKITLGAQIEARGVAEVGPGTELDAELIFWDDVARVHATPGAPFVLRYDGRAVGAGLFVEDDAAIGSSAYRSTSSRQPWVVCYDYGMGGLWAVIWADSEDEILSAYPELTVFDAPPAWMSREAYNEHLSEREQHDLAGEAWGLLSVVLADRAKAHPPPSSPSE